MSDVTKRTVWFALYSVGVVGANFAAFSALARFALDNPTASHVLAIPLVSLVLVYGNRESTFAVIRPSPWLGGAVMLSGLLLAIAARVVPLSGTSPLSAAAAGIVLLWIGGFLLCSGVEAARAAMFPLGFLVFMVPLPAPILNAVTTFLKVGSAEAVDKLFALTGTPFHRQGFVFALPDVVIEIADECSGIRSSMALLLTSLLAGYRFLNSTWAKVLLVLVIVPITILKNAVRIVTLSLLSIHVDPSFLTGQLHHEGGMAFFVLALVLFAPFFVLLRQYESLRAERESAS